MTQKHKDEIKSRIIKFITKQPLPKAICGCEKPCISYIGNMGLLSLHQTFEMLTINECTEQFHGLTSYTLRKLAAQGKVKFTRAGEGTRGKILINKDSLISYLQK